MIIFSNLWSCWFWLTIYFIALLGCTCIVRFRFHHEESLFPPSHLPQYIPSSPLYCSLYSLTLGVGKPTLHMDDLPGGSNILEIKIFGPQQIYFTSRVRMLTRAGALEIGRLAAPRNWAWPPGWWLTSALPSPGQSKWSQFTQDLHHCKYLNIKWGGELNNYT